MEIYLAEARSRISRMFMQIRQMVHVLFCAMLLFEFDFLPFAEINPREFEFEPGRSE
jgi:hypothetical protein